MKEALLYEKSADNQVHCFLCAHRCRIAPDGFGICGVRQNIKGELFTHTYGKLIAAHVDPIEKKPLYHFLPGTPSYSVATAGCNFRCGFCQNWEISQLSVRDGTIPRTREYRPEEIVSSAEHTGCASIAYTYTEPTVYFELAYETAQLARQQGLKNVFVTNGFMTAQAIEMIAPYLDAANIDLKYGNAQSYKTICGGDLQPVLDSIRLMRTLGIWVEVTTLVVPGSNDSDEELGGIADFLASVDKDLPWHISRFFPQYKFNETKPTPEETLKKAEQCGRRAGLRYIYTGNISGWGGDTVCSRCGKTAIKREGFEVVAFNIKDDCCVYCQQRIPGVFV
jgi:pyruvate formate lyase activating enzyme